LARSFFWGGKLTSKLVKQSLVTASLVTVGTNVFGRIFGYAREAAIAGHFGTSSTFDTFILAFTVPEFMTFIIFAALPPALIPLMRKNASETQGERFRLFWEGLISFTIIFGLLSILIYLFREKILWCLAPNLTEQQRTIGERLMTILSWFVFFRGVEAFFRSCLYDKKHFIVPATSPIIANIIILVLIFSLYDELNIEALAYGWLLASAALFFYNGIFAFLLVKPTALSGVHLSSVKTLLRMTAALAIIACIALIYPVIDRYLAAKYLGEGQVAALRYATFLAHIPPGMFVTAFAMASFPWISDLSVPEETERLRRLYQNSLRFVIFVMALVVAGMVTFSTEIVRIAFQRGAFDFTSLQLTESPFRIFSLGIIFYSVHLYQVRFYYAATTLLRLGAILTVMLIIKSIMSLILVNPMEQDGLALATGIAWLSGCIIMTIDLGRSLKVSNWNVFTPYSLKVLLSVFGATLFWIVMSHVWPGTEVDSLMAVFIRLLLLTLGGIAVYIGMAVALKLPEPKKMLMSLRSKTL